MDEKQKPRVYLDWAASAPLDPAARAAMLDAHANPSSVHAEGRAARAALESARAAVLSSFGVPGTCIFTSGASEALRLAIGGARAACVLVSAIEHEAVQLAAPGATIVPVDPTGQVDPGALAAMLAAAPAPALVCVMHANNETGVVQPIADIARVVRGAGGLLLVDAVQSALRLPWPDADFVAVSAHKLGGPPGVGALVVRDPALLPPGGGAQEGGHRPGTQNLPGIRGFAAALRARATDPAWVPRVAALRERLEARLIAAGADVAGEVANRLPHISCVRMAGVEAMRQLMLFDLQGFAVSAGAACSSGRVRASHVLRAMGWSKTAAGEAIRVSLGWTTTAADVDAFAEAWERAAVRLAPNLAVRAAA